MIKGQVELVKYTTDANGDMHEVSRTKQDNTLSTLFYYEYWLSATPLAEVASQNRLVSFDQVVKHIDGASYSAPSIPLSMYVSFAFVEATETEMAHYLIRGRFSSPNAGTTRSIVTVALIDTSSIAETIAYVYPIAIATLDTPCTQLDTEIVDLYYRVFVDWENQIPNYPSRLYSNEERLAIGKAQLQGLMQQSRFYPSVPVASPYKAEILEQYSPYLQEYVSYSDDQWDGQGNVYTVSLSTDFRYRAHKHTITVQEQYNVGRPFASTMYYMSSELYMLPGNIPNQGYSQNIYKKNRTSVKPYLDLDVVADSYSSMVVADDSGWTRTGEFPYIYRVKYVAPDGATPQYLVYRKRMICGTDGNTWRYPAHTTFPVSKLWNKHSSYITGESHTFLNDCGQYGLEYYGSPSNVKDDSNANSEKFNVMSYTYDEILSFEAAGITIADRASRWMMNIPFSGTGVIRDVHYDHSGRIWVATDDNGLKYVDVDLVNKTYVISDYSVGVLVPGVAVRRNSDSSVVYWFENQVLKALNITSGGAIGTEIDLSGKTAYTANAPATAVKIMNVDQYGSEARIAWATGLTMHIYDITNDIIYNASVSTPLSDTEYYLFKSWYDFDIDSDFFMYSPENNTTYVIAKNATAYTSIGTRYAQWIAEDGTTYGQNNTGYLDKFGDASKYDYNSGENLEYGVYIGYGNFLSMYESVPRIYGIGSIGYCNELDLAKIDWVQFGWNGSQWVEGDNTPRHVTNGTHTIPDGIQVTFSGLTGDPLDCVPDDFFDIIMYDGIYSDNATEFTYIYEDTLWGKNEDTSITKLTDGDLIEFPLGVTSVPTSHTTESASNSRLYTTNLDILNKNIAGTHMYTGDAYNKISFKLYVENRQFYEIYIGFSTQDGAYGTADKNGTAYPYFDKAGSSYNTYIRNPGNIGLEVSNTTGYSPDPFDAADTLQLNGILNGEFVGSANVTYADIENAVLTVEVTRGATGADDRLSILIGGTPVVTDAAPVGSTRPAKNTFSITTSNNPTNTSITFYDMSMIRDASNMYIVGAASDPEFGGLYSPWNQTDIELYANGVPLVQVTDPVEVPPEGQFICDPMSGVIFLHPNDHAKTITGRYAWVNKRFK